MVYHAAGVCYLLREYRLTPSIAVAANVDGRLEVFARDASGEIWHTAESTALQHLPLGGAPRAHPVPNVPAPQLRRRLGVPTSWSDWERFGIAGAVLDCPIVVANRDGRLELFVLVGNEVWHRWQESPGRNWTDWLVLTMPVTEADGIVVAKNLDGRLEVFVGSNSRLHHTWQILPNGEWSALRPVSLLSSPDVEEIPAVVRSAGGCLQVFMRAGDGIWSTKQNVSINGWLPWHDLGEPQSHLYGDVSANHSPTAAVNEDGRVEVFVVSSAQPNLGSGNPDCGLWHRRQQASGVNFDSWELMNHTGLAGDGFKFLGQVTVLANKDGRLEIFGQTGDCGVVHSWQTQPNGGWSAFEYMGLIGHSQVKNRHGQEDAVPIVGLCAADGCLELFAADAKGMLVHSFQLVPGGTWSAWHPMNVPAAMFST